MRRSLLLVTFVTSCMPSGALAQPLELSWEAPPECARVAAIRAEVARIAPVESGRALEPLSAHVHISKRGGRYRLSLRTGSSGERVLVADDCRDLERDVTLLLALALGEGQGLPPQPEPEPQPARPPVVALPPPPPAAAPPAPPEARRDPWRVTLLAGGGGDFRMLPRVAGQLLVGLELGFAHYWLAPRVSWWPQVDQSLARGIRADYTAFSGALTACLGLPLAATRLSACVGADVAALTARSRGASESGAATAPLYAAAGAVAWRWPVVTRIHVQLELQLRVALNQPRFVVDGFAETHAVPRVLPALSAAVGFSLL